MNDDPNKLFKALAKLRGIKAHIKEQSFYTNEKYIREYNEAIDEIESSINDDMDTFLVPPEEIKPKKTGFAPSTGTRYSSDNWCETQLLLIKIDSAIAYMELLLQDQKPKQQFGFSDSK